MIVNVLLKIKMSRKKLVLIILIVLAVGVLVFYRLVQDRKEIRTNVDSEPSQEMLIVREGEPDYTQPLISTENKTSPKPTVPDSSKIEISNVKVNNFYDDSKKINSSGDRLILEQSDFEAIYFPRGNQFLISVLTSPFYKTRLDAEKAFLEKLDISEKEACKLDVSITTPNFVNPNEAGIDFTLSFCK